MCLVEVKTGKMKNRGRKIGWKMLFSTVWLGKENKKDRKPGRKFSLLSPHFFILPNWEEKLERKVLSQHFYTNTLFPPTFIHDLMTLSPTPLDDFCPQTILITFASSHLTFTAHQHPTVQVLFSLSFFFFFFFST